MRSEEMKWSGVKREEEQKEREIRGTHDGYNELQ